MHLYMVGVLVKKGVFKGKRGRKDYATIRDVYAFRADSGHAG